MCFPQSQLIQVFLKTRLKHWCTLMSFNVPALSVFLLLLFLFQSSIAPKRLQLSTIDLWSRFKYLFILIFRNKESDTPDSLSCCVVALCDWWEKSEREPYPLSLAIPPLERSQRSGGRGGR
jgi:hypothetical protein